MKKTYIEPDLEVVMLNMNQQLLTGSTDAEVSNETQSNDDALAPIFVFDNL